MVLCQLLAKHRLTISVRPIRAVDPSASHLWSYDSQHPSCNVCLLAVTAVLAVVANVSDDQRMHMGAAVWIGLGAAALIISSVLLLRRKPVDGFGAVSDRWV